MYKAVRLRLLSISGIFPEVAKEYDKVHVAIRRLLLTDPAIEARPDVNPALGQGFRCGFLGILHLDVFKQRYVAELGLLLSRQASYWTCLLCVAVHLEPQTSCCLSLVSYLPRAFHGFEHPRSCPYSCHPVDLPAWPNTGRSLSGG